MISRLVSCMIQSYNKAFGIFVRGLPRLMFWQARFMTCCELLVDLNLKVLKRDLANIEINHETSQEFLYMRKIEYVDIFSNFLGLFNVNIPSKCLTFNTTTQWP